MSLAANGRSHLLRITEIGEHGARDIEARGIDPDDLCRRPPAPPARAQAAASTSSPASRSSLFLDLPLLRGDEPPAAGYVAAAQNPWPGGDRRLSLAGHVRLPAQGDGVRAPAVTGVTLDPLCRRRHLALRARQQPCASRLDQGASPRSPISPCSAAPTPPPSSNADGEWEVLQFASAVLTAPATYLLSGLLRGQAGTELAMRAPSPPAPASSCSTARSAAST